MKNFIPKKFFTELEDTLSNMYIESYSASIDDNVNSVIDEFKEMHDRHARLRPISKKEQRLSNIP